MQKEDKVCNITPANRVGSVQEFEGSSRDECRRQERHQPWRG